MSLHGRTRFDIELADRLPLIDPHRAEVEPEPPFESRASRRPFSAYGQPFVDRTG